MRVHTVHTVQSCLAETFLRLGDLILYPHLSGRLVLGDKKQVFRRRRERGLRRWCTWARW